MKVSSLFDLISDGRDVLTFFEGVSSREQLVSRLERLKREGTDELLECVESLQMSIASALGDTLEMSAVLDDEPEPEIGGIDDELDKIAAEEGEDEEEGIGEDMGEDMGEEVESAAAPAEAEKQNPEAPPEPEDPKNDVTPPG